jgi:hypothetical protein
MITDLTGQKSFLAIGDQEQREERRADTTTAGELHKSATGEGEEE